MIKKRALIFMSSLVFFFCYVSALSQAYALSTSAASAVLLSADTGEVLYEKDAYTCRSMASTTKIMTAYLALKQGTPELAVTITKDMLAEGTAMGLKVGDSVTLEGLVYGMLLQSGNDAANAAAVAVSGSVEAFVELMNTEAQRLGMKNTHFVTPSGLDAKEHYSTAYDMAILASAAADMPEFLYVCSQRSASVAFIEPQVTVRYENHNRLLYSYDGAVGMKTGFTKKSGRCLVSAAVRDGVKLVAVTLNDGNDWNDHINMLDYGFSVMKTEKLDIDDKLSLTVVGGEKRNVSVSLSDSAVYTYTGDLSGNIKYTVLLKHFEYAPVEKGDIVGEVRFYEDSKLAAVSALIADGDVGLLQYEQQIESDYTPWFVKLWRSIKGLFD